MAIVKGPNPRQVSPHQRGALPVLLYETQQLKSPQFRIDLASYLQLDTPLSDAATAQEAPSASPKHTALDICQPEYTALQKELLEIGDVAQTWIRHYFVKQPSVHVSDPAQFDALL